MTRKNVILTYPHFYINLLGILSQTSHRIRHKTVFKNFFTMAKPLRLVLAFFMVNTIIYNASSQSLGVNTSGSPAANSAILDVSSTDKGMLIPRMSKTERTGIIS